MWYKFSQQQTQELDPNQYRQNIPSGGELQINLSGGDINMGPEDPPKQIEVTTDAGEQKSIYLLHGTPEGQLVFGDQGSLQYGSGEDFENWLRETGKPVLPYISCYGSQVVGSSGGADELINASGAVQVGVRTMPDGTEKVVFSQ